jgi:aryl-alcohol dehydrogenase-like predicted oxidoreductase
MQMRRLGDSGLEVSAIGMGTLTWGNETDIHEARDCLRAFLDSGGNLLDISDRYADGVAEEILGELLADEGYRPNITLMGKSGRQGEQGKTDASRRHLLRSLDASLKRLGTDNLDIWVLDGFDPTTPLAETIQTMQQAVIAGKARYFAVSEHAGWQVAAATLTAKQASPGLGVIAAQTEYSLLARQAELEVIPSAQNLGVGVIALSPLGRGVLTGKYRFGMPADSRGASPKDREWVAPYLAGSARNVVDAVCTAAEGLGVAPLEVALAWGLSRPGVSSCIVGARTVGQLQAVLNADENLLVDEISQALSDVSAVNT